WGDRPKAYHTWYEPFDEQAAIERSVRFVLSQPITAFASPGDTRLLPMAIAAAENFRAMEYAEQQAVVKAAVDYQPLFAPA
ncbi:MAG: aldo/keto reductase, partial [Chloroflexi bacterium]|nr:aldo/keto reductase [Chloroflexota bacterium]